MTVFKRELRFMFIHLFNTMNNEIVSKETENIADTVYIVEKARIKIY